MLAVRVFETFRHGRNNATTTVDGGLSDERERYIFCAKILLVFYVTRRLSSARDCMYLCSAQQ